jgi:hypothetical protein
MIITPRIFDEEMYKIIELARDGDFKNAAIAILQLKNAIFEIKTKL